MEKNREYHFLLSGISHRTAPVEIRENFTFDRTKRQEILGRLRTIPGIDEAVLLCTCNRTEFYIASSSAPENLRESLIGFMALLGGSVSGDFFYCLKDREVVEHLFRVAGGLDSMILGEPQIFGQVKEAYSEACEEGHTGFALNRLFHSSFRAGKIARYLTGIGEGTVSAGFAAVELAASVFGKLEGRPVLLVGAGDTGELCALKLVESGVNPLYISNRTEKKAVELASKLSGEIIPFDEIHKMCGHVDVIISSVHSDKPVFRKKEIQENIVGRDGSSLVFVDLGVPRSIEDGAGELDGVYLYNIDDLEKVSLENIQKRRAEAEKAELLLKAEVEEFCARFNDYKAAPIIRDIRKRCEKIRLEELEKIRNKVPDDAFAVLDMVTRRIVRKILHNPTIAMRATEEEKRTELMKIVQELFMKDEQYGVR